MDAETGVMVSGLAVAIVIVAVFVAPVVSVIVRVTVSGHALAGTVTLNVDDTFVHMPLSPASLQRLFALESLHALSGSLDVTVNGPVPPVIVNVITLKLVLTTVNDGGVTSMGPAAAAVTVTLTLPDFPPADAVIVAAVFALPAASVGAVNVAVARPPVVWANGVTLPLFVVKLTVVPSGTGLPPTVVTTAVIWEVLPEAIDSGSATTVT